MIHRILPFIMKVSEIYGRSPGIKRGLALIRRFCFRAAFLFAILLRAVFNESAARILFFAFLARLVRTNGIIVAGCPAVIISGIGVSFITTLELLLNIDLTLLKRSSLSLSIIKTTNK